MLGGLNACVAFSLTLALIALIRSRVNKFANVCELMLIKGLLGELVKACRLLNALMVRVL